jgi:hypothetical protein
LGRILFEIRQELLPQNFGADSEIQRELPYESTHTYPLTNESLTQICGKNTTFIGISCGYGIWPPRKINKLPENAHIDDWGYTEWHTKNSRIRNYFT